MSHNNKTCITCAKAKIKCDKETPNCGRCVRLGIECSAQLRGRGRPPNPKDSSSASSKPKKQYVPGGGTRKPSAGTRRVERPKPNYLLIESLKDALTTDSPWKTDEKEDETRIKTTAVSKWLLNVACCAGFEALHDGILEIVESLDIDDEVRDSVFEARPPLSDEEKAMVQIPNYIAGANCAGIGYLVQASSGGSSVFFANEDMAADYVSAAEADEIYATSSGDPDCIMRRLVATRDRPAYLKCMTELILRSAGLLSEASLICHIHTRQASPPTLCLVTLRASFSPDGEEVVFGVKIAPLPDSGYLHRPLEPSQPAAVPAAPHHVSQDELFVPEKDEEGFDERAHREDMAQKRKRVEEREAKGKRRTVAPSHLACFEVESASPYLPPRKNSRPGVPKVPALAGTEGLEEAENIGDFSEVFAFPPAKEESSIVDALLDFEV